MRPCCTLGVRARRIHSGAPALALRATADGTAGTWGTACSGSLRCERTYAATLAAECGVVASGVGRRRASPGLASEKCSETYAVLPRAAGKRLHGRVASDRTRVALRASREWRRNTAAHGSVSVANCACAVQLDVGGCADVPAPRYSGTATSISPHGLAGAARPKLIHRWWTARVTCKHSEKVRPLSLLWRGGFAYRVAFDCLRCCPEQHS